MAGGCNTKSLKMTFPVVVLLAVFAGIAVRQIGGIRLQIWQVMLGGACTVLITGGIEPAEALHAIEPDIMLFLFGMFVLGRALEVSGWLAHTTYALFRRAGSADSLLLLIVFGAGLLSALLMNDTIAIIGTPLMLLLARQHSMHTKPLLLALAFSVTTGSVMSPIGNPQNLLIAMSGNMNSPFYSFGWYLLPPTLVNLLITYLWLKWRFREHFGERALEYVQEDVVDLRLARIARFGMRSASCMVALKILLATLGSGLDFPLTWIAVAGMLPVAVLSSRRFEIVKGIDWQTLVFFASMFVLMRSVWLSGFFQEILQESGADITSIPAIMTVSIALSQLVSNVPLVALYLPLLAEPDVSVPSLAALAAASTIAGNMMIPGAASNVIIVQQAENRGAESVSFVEFAMTGIPLTLVNALVYVGYLLSVIGR